MTGNGHAPAQTINPAGPSSQRIDKWLWCARLFKTRTLAAKIVSAGGVRLTRAAETIRIEKPSTLVRIGDKVVFLIGDRLKVMEVQACGLRRGPASEAQLLYVDRSPPPLSKDQTADVGAGRGRGAGRPTKKERRAVDRLKDAS